MASTRQRLPLRDRLAERQIKKLHKDVEYMQEHIKLLNKRFENMQDQHIRLAVEQDAIVKGIKFITDAAEALIEEKTGKSITPEEKKGTLEQHYR